MVKSAEADDVALGKKLVADGKLQQVRDQLGLSATVQAHMVGVQPIMIHSWENGKSSPSAASARKVVKWYNAAMDSLAEQDVESGDLLHVSRASQLLGTSYGTLFRWWEEGMIECMDLGVLGLYVRRSQVEEMASGGES